MSFKFDVSKRVHTPTQIVACLSMHAIYVRYFCRPLTQTTLPFITPSHVFCFCISMRLHCTTKFPTNEF